MLTTLRVQNYKSWEDSGDIALAELTGFFGVNGTGKTALLEATQMQRPDVCYFEKCDSPAPVEAAAQWLQEIGFIYSYRLENDHLFVKTAEGTPHIAIAEANRGLRQIFAIANFCFSAAEGATLLFEQPEFGLHPLAQAELAELFITSINERKVQIIVESHSEYFLHRLQRRIAEKHIGSDCIALYHCRLDETGKSQILRLKMDKYGNVHNFPDKFLGDSLGDALAMSKAEMSERVKEDREKKINGVKAVDARVTAGSH
jgi:predicted ATPase